MPTANRATVSFGQRYQNKYGERFMEQRSNPQVWKKVSNKSEKNSQ